MHHWQARLTQAWGRRGPLAWCLWPLSALLQLVWHARRGLQALGLLGPPADLPVPVWVVGNVLAGGTGKTPLLMALADWLGHQGVRVGVISRGYGRTQTALTGVTPMSHADEVGDEPLLIHRHCGVPVWVGSDRVEAARALLRAHPEVQLVLSDDGLQRLDLPRAVEWVVFDARGLGNGWLWPAGPLREPWPRPTAQGVRQVTVRTHAEGPVGEHRVERRLANHAQRADGQVRPLTNWLGQDVGALAGIAQPEAFFAALREQGLALTQTHALTDHARAWPVLTRPPADWFCTEKDAVKLWHHDPAVWAVGLEVHWSPELEAELHHTLRWLGLSLPHGQQTA